MLPRINSDTDTAETAFRTKSNELYNQLLNDGKCESGAVVLTSFSKTVAVDLSRIIYTASGLSDKITQTALQVRGDMLAFL